MYSYFPGKPPSVSLSPVEQIGEGVDGVVAAAAFGLAVEVLVAGLRRGRRRWSQLLVYHSILVLALQCKSVFDKLLLELYFNKVRD